MKFRVLSVALILGSILIAGCSNNFIRPDQASIDAYIQGNPDLPELDKSCIYDGRFEIGMLQETVRFLLGEAKNVQTVQQPWALQEHWSYKKGNVKVFIMEDKHVVGIIEKD